MTESFALGQDAISILLDDATNLQKEIEEQDAARKAHDAEAQRIAAEQLMLAQARVDEVGRTAATQSALLDEISQNNARTAEIQDSLPLRIIEPIAGIFNPNFSRKKLAQENLRAAEQMKISAARDELSHTKTVVKTEALSSQLAVAKAKLAKETGDATSAAAAMEIVRQREVDRRTLAVTLMNETEDLDALAKERPELLQLINDEKLIRSGKERQERMGRVSERAQQLSLERTELESIVTDEELAKSSDALVQKYGVQRLRDEAMRRYVKRSIESQTLTQGNQQAGSFYADIMDYDTLAKAVSASTKNGGAPIVHQADNGAKITIPYNVALTALHKRNEGLAQATLAEETQRVTEANVAIGLESVMRSNNLPYDPEVPLSKKLEMIARNPAISPEERQMATAVHTQLKAAEQLSAENKSSAELAYAAAMDGVAKLQTASLARRLEGLPNERKVSMESTLKTGMIESGEVSLSTIVSAGATGDQTISPAYNLSMATLVAESRKPLKPSGDGTNAAAFTTDPKEKLLFAAADNRVQQAAALPIYAEIFQTAMVETLESTGQRPLANLIIGRDPAVVQNGQFSLPKFMAAAREANPQFDAQAFRAEIAKRLDSVTRRVTRPEGPNADVIAALNHQLFQNNPQIWTREFVARSFNKLREAEAAPISGRNIALGLSR